ncbi:fatty acid desaturase family protein [Streptomyces sp. NPDC088923]|uniref:fatty acid desaturase family protein n=1 Tax=Streptomyces sp. NPDC088923 TaxID=3365913 RepID=UPI00380461B6
MPTVEKVVQTTGKSDPGLPVKPRRKNEARSVRAEYRHIRKEVDGRVFAAKLALLCALVLGAGALVWHGALWSRVLGGLVLGVMFAHALELQHEALHGIGFAGRRKNVVAGVLLGLPMLTSFAGYQASHMRHHRDLGTPENEEFFDYGDQYGDQDRGRLRTACLWLYRFSMIAHYGQFFVTAGRLLTGRPLPKERRATVRRMRRDHVLMVLAIAAAVIGSVLTGSTFMVWAWLLPLLVVAGPVHAAIELPEHFRTETETTDPFRNTRSILSNRFMAWLTNGNNFHVEHHLMPTLPISQLGELHEAMSGRHVYYNRTYAEFFRGLRQRSRRKTA